jgi:hypothetical protein
MLSRVAFWGVKGALQSDKAYAIPPACTSPLITEDLWGWAAAGYTFNNRFSSSNLCIPGKGIVRTQSQFLHSCVCGKFIYSQDWSTYLAAANRETDPGNI